jgi:3-oxoacyl-[acyl-carrier-protein] synthase-3
MPERIKVRIAGTGRFAPPKVMTNQDLEKIVDTNDEWIRSRTGIERRHVAEKGVGSSALGIEAARKALDSAGLKGEDVDFIIVATGTPDYYAFPNTASIIQKELGAKGAPAMDVSAACSGAVYALYTAHQLVASGDYQNVLVIGAEVMTSVLNWDDRDTCVLFGDGAGALVLQPAADDKSGEILGHYLSADGSGGELLIVPGGGSRNPASAETLQKKMHGITMQGTLVFKYAVQAMADSTRKVLAKCGVKAEEVKLIIPHQANDRIIEAVARQLKLPREQFLSNIAEYGNTMAATTLIGLDEAREEGRVKEGDLVLLVVFGAGFTTGASLIRL